MELFHRTWNWYTVWCILIHFSGHYTSYDDVALGISPFCHAYGLLLALMCMCEGTRVVVVHKFKPDVFIPSIKEHKVSLRYRKKLTNLAETEYYYADSTMQLIIDILKHSSLINSKKKHKFTPLHRKQI